MKHMKRALSLVLAMVMLLGMMVIPTGAVSNFKDEAEITYNEAVEVTSGLGLFAGSDGKFLPKGTVTRAQMATIIVKMLHGSEANADSFKGVNGGFTDTASFEGGWAEGYINWCASLGVVAGYGDGTFRPGQAVTTAEAATMILNALQVDAGAGSWPFTVMSKAEELKFFKDLSPKPDTNQALTREELAVIALHGLEYSPEGKMGYVYNGVVYDDYMAAYLAAGRDASKVDPAKKDSLAADVFGLKSVTGFVTGNQATGDLEYTELKAIVNGAPASYKFAIETDQTAIGHYVTVYYDEQYTNEKNPGTTYTIFDEATVVEVTEDIDSRADFRDAFGSGSIKLSTAEACVIESDYTVKAGYPKANGFAANDVTFVTGDTYNVPAGTYIVYENAVVSYIAPATVVASIVDSIESYAGEESVSLRGVDNPIPNNEEDDMVDEYLAMEAKDYVTYTMVGSRYVLERVRVVTGKVSSISTTEINGNTYDVVTVDGVDYVAFIGEDGNGNPVGGTNHTDLNDDINHPTYGVNYTDTYDFYVTRDGKFIGYKANDGGFNVDNVAYILGVIETTKKDSYGEATTTYFARGVDMNGVEVMLPVAVKKDGKDLLGDTSSLAEGFYKVKDHTDKDARKEGIQVLDPISSVYNKDTNPVFASSYTSGQVGMAVGGSGTYSHGNATAHAASRFLVLDGTLGQSTPLKATLKTGSVTVVLDETYNTRKPAALLSKKGGALEVEVVVFPVGNVADGLNEQRIYVSAEQTRPVGTNANGNVYDVYAASAGTAMQITLKEENIAKPGFYRVVLDPETNQHRFVTTTEDSGYIFTDVSSYTTDNDKLTALGHYYEGIDLKDGVASVSVLYDQTLTNVYNNKLYSDTWFNNVNVSGAVVVDTRSDKEVEASRVSRINSLARLTTLKDSEEDLTVMFDLWYSTYSKKVLVMYITDVGKDSRSGTLLASTEDANRFTVLKSVAPTLKEGDSFTVDADMELIINGESDKGLFLLKGITPNKVILAPLSTASSQGDYGLHNVVVRTEEHEGKDYWVLVDAHRNNGQFRCDIEQTTCWNTGGEGAEATMYLDVSNENIKVYDFVHTGNEEIKNMTELKAAVEASLPDWKTYNKLVLSYYCEGGYGDETPEAIFIMADNGSIKRSDTEEIRFWRLMKDEWAYFDLDYFPLYPLENQRGNTLTLKPLDVFVDDKKENVYLHYYEVSGAPTDNGGEGVYKAVANAYGRTTLVYQTPGALTEVKDTDILLNSNSEYTIAEIVENMKWYDYKYQGNRMEGPDGKMYVYVYSETKALRQFSLMNGDVIDIDIDEGFAPNTGYVEATVVSIENYPNAPDGWKVLAKFDEVEGTATGGKYPAGEYEVLVDAGVITLRKLEIVDDLNDLNGITITFNTDTVHAAYQDETWLREHIGDDLLTVKAKKVNTTEYEIQSVSYKVPEDAILYMAQNPKAYQNTGSGEFYVVNNAGKGYLKVGDKHFFTFDEDYFYTTNEDVEAARVFCYGWEDGKLLSTSAMGVRKGNLLNTDYLHPSDSEGVADTFGAFTNSLYQGHLGYHRVVRWKDLRPGKDPNIIYTKENSPGEYIMSAVQSCIYIGGSSYNCGGIHGIIGSCYSGWSGNTHDGPNSNMDITNAVFVDTRTNVSTRINSAEEFVEQATAAGQVKGEELVINYISAGKHSVSPCVIDYVVITDLTYPTP